MPRGANAYMMFVKDKRASVVAAHPNLKITEVSKKLGELWRALSDNKKETYKKQASLYVPKVKPAKNDPTKLKPKRKLNSYMKFANEKRSELMKAHPSLKIGDIAKKMGELWRALSDDDKKKYT